MPTYEYQCPTCGDIHTEVRKIADRNDPVFCRHEDETVANCTLVISRPAKAVFVGAEPASVQRQAEVKRRHEEYKKSDKFYEETREQVFKLHKRGTI